MYCNYWEGLCGRYYEFLPLKSRGNCRKKSLPLLSVKSPTIRLINCSVHFQPLLSDQRKRYDLK